ncbi:MAG TPA: hypothetical protein VJ974_08665 [Geopsychrobacteraceae bacterium]|nr:hypothetical protein [Geopsychrobacteraceae bacterium]
MYNVLHLPVLVFLPALIFALSALAAKSPSTTNVAQLEKMTQPEKVIFDTDLKKAIRYRRVPLNELVPASPDQNQERTKQC